MRNKRKLFAATGSVVIDGGTATVFAGIDYKVYGFEMDKINYERTIKIAEEKNFTPIMNLPYENMHPLPKILFSGFQKNQLISWKLSDWKLIRQITRNACYSLAENFFIK